MLPTKKLLFVYNPKSGKAQIRSKLADILSIFAEAEYEITVYPTKGPSDATTAVVDRSKDYDRIICCGGDGTLDEVVFGVMETVNKLPIGYIPAGSTNDYARSLNIPSNMLKAAKVAVGDNLFRSDIGSLNDAFFVYVAAFGVFTEVTYATPQNMKNTLGHSAYLLEAIKSLPSIKSYHCRIIWEEGSIEGDFIYGMVTNSISVGGFKGITGQHIYLDDGYAEVTFVRAPASPIELNESVLALIDRRIESPNLISFKTSHIRIESEEPISWTRDGEYGGTHTTADITIHPQALEIFVP